MKRQIIEINEEKCIGCGLCASACEQGAIQLIDGKARLVSDSYCDGLGMCLPTCPVDAIKLSEQEANPFDHERKGFAINDSEESHHECGCSGSAPVTFTNATHTNDSKENHQGCACSGSAPITFPNATDSEENHHECSCSGSAPIAFTSSTATQEADHFIQAEPSRSLLQQWPVQISLLSPNAPYLENANLLIAADCCAYAYGNFHNDFIKNKVTMIACPKLDSVEPYIEKLTAIFTNRHISSVTVVRMSVPCCGGLTHLVKKAIRNSCLPIPYAEVTITPDGNIQE
jgi:ferredoxin